MQLTRFRWLHCIHGHLGTARLGQPDDALLHTADGMGSIEAVECTVVAKASYTCELKTFTAKHSNAITRSDSVKSYRTLRD